jgi:hypothetical protein
MLKHFWMISVKHILLQTILKPDRQSCGNTAVFRYEDIFNASSCLTDVTYPSPSSKHAVINIRLRVSTATFEIKVDYLVYTAKST